MIRLAERLGANRTVVALSVARMGDAIGNSVLFIVLPLYVPRLPAETFRLPETVRVGILLSVFGLVGALFQPLFGALSDRLGRRKVFIQAGLALMALGTLAFFVARHFRELLLLRAVQGVGVGLTIPASLALMATVSRRESRGGAMGIYTSARMVGFASGPLIGGFFLDRYGFGAAFCAGTAAILLAFVLVQAWVHEPLRPPGRRSEPPEPLGSRHAEAADAAPAVPFRVFDRDLLRSGILGVGFATFSMASAFSQIVALEKQFNERLHETAVAFGAAFSALMVSRLVFQIPLGHASDRWGRKPFVVGGLLLMAPATASLGWVTGTLQLVGAQIVQGMASAAIAAPAFALVADLSRGGGEGRQMAVVTTSFGLGLALGPLLAGLLATVSFQLPFVVGAAMSLAAALVVHRSVPETVTAARG